MKYKVVLELYDVYGGDGITRSEVVKETKLKRTMKKTMTRVDVGLPVIDDEMDEEQTQMIEREIQTFRLDEQGRPILRIGGPHGKLYGAFKDVAAYLKIAGESPFTSSHKKLLNSVIATPIWIPLDMNGSEMTIQEIPQILAGMGNKMIIMKFDAIPKCKMEVVLTFPDAFEEAVKKLIKGLESISLFNKRRCTAKVLEVSPC